MTEQTFIKGKDAALEDSITSMQAKLKTLNIDVEEASWLNPIPNILSVHIRDKDCGLMFTNGKGHNKKNLVSLAPLVNILNGLAVIIFLLIFI